MAGGKPLSTLKHLSINTLTLQPRMFYRHFVAIKRVTLNLTHDSTEKAGIIEFCTEKFESLIALINLPRDRKEPRN